MGMICTTQNKQGYYSKLRSRHEHMDYKHQAIKTNQNPFNKLNKDTQTIFKHHIFEKLNKNSKSKKTRARNVKYFEKNREPIPFS